MDIKELKARASGQWSPIAQRLGISSDHLTGRPGPCPKCGGKDRFRVFADFSETGGAVCNRCGRFGDGISLVQWSSGCSLPEAIKKVAAELGIEVTQKRSPTLAEKNPEKHLEFIPWSDAIARFWATKKRPIEESALKIAGACQGRYRKQYPVIALPIIGKESKPVGWCMYHSTGKELPVFHAGSSEPEWTKIKIAGGSGAGWIGSPAREGEEFIWKPEGPSDALALLSLPLPQNHSVITNAFGCGEDPAKNIWMLDRLKGKTVFVVHDCDQPGQDGAIAVTNGKKVRPGWAPAIAIVAGETRNVVLPYPIEQEKGKDLRDWIIEQLKTKSPEEVFQALFEMAQKSQRIERAKDFQPEEEISITTLAGDREHVDDPHRLARINLEKYESLYGRSLVYWRETWYSWENGVYSAIGSDHLFSRINYSIKEEFDKAWETETQKYIQWRKSDAYDPEKDRGIPKVRKVTSGLVRNVYEASKGLCTLRSGQEIHDWTDKSIAPNGICIAVENGILNITAAITSGTTREDVLLPHSRNWFSTSKLGFEFDENAQCPEWVKFLDSVFNNDTEAILALQKWFGYLLTPDNRLQKILFVIGQPRSGKGTIIQVMKSLFGESNIATPTLAELSKDFSLETLAQKTIAIIADARLSDRVDQNIITERLLSISGGDPQNIQRKYKETLSAAVLKTRFTLFSNLLPKLSDLSMAFLSRCIFLHMPNTYLGKEDLGLSAKLLKELPGVLNWAIIGRHLLDAHMRIEQPASGESLKIEMKSMMSPVFEFLEDACQKFPGYWIDTKEMFRNWETWCDENDNKYPGNVSSLSRKIKAIDPGIQVEQYKINGEKKRRFVGIKMKDIDF